MNIQEAIEKQIELSKPKFLYTRLSDDPQIKYVRRIQNLDFFEEENARKIKETFISQYGQLYDQQCTMHKTPALKGRPRQQLISKEEYEKKKQLYFNKIVAVNTLKTIKYIDSQIKLDMRGQTSLPKNGTISSNERDVHEKLVQMKAMTQNLNEDSHRDIIEEEVDMDEASNEIKTIFSQVQQVRKSKEEMKRRSKEQISPK